MQRLCHLSGQVQGALFSQLPFVPEKTADSPVVTKALSTNNLQGEIETDNLRCSAMDQRNVRDMKSLQMVCCQICTAHHGSAVLRAKLFALLIGGFWQTSRAFDQIEGRHLKCKPFVVDGGPET